MRIEAWMKKPVHVVRPRDSVLHARELMERHRVNQLPVVLDGRLVGILTDRDLRDAFPSALAPPSRRRSTAAGDPTEAPVEDVMSANVLTLGPRDALVDAARLMRRERIGALPIVEGRRLVGILTRSDLLDALVELAEAGAKPAGAP
jgi:acetoin utilization protein AcuB